MFGCLLGFCFPCCCCCFGVVVVVCLLVDSVSLNLFLLFVFGFICLFLSFVCVCLFLFGQFCFYYLPWALFACFIFLFATPCGLWGSWFPHRGSGLSPCGGIAKSEPLGYQRISGPREYNQRELSWRSSSLHQDLAPPNCLQAPVLHASGQTTSNIGTQPHTSTKIRRQGNMLQTKEQGEHLQNKINEEEIGNLPEKEFRVMIVRMIQNLRNRMEARIEKLQQMFNKDLEELKNKQTLRNNTTL